jgi:hypothetical protein
MATPLSELQIQKVIMDAEKKHGHETHMVIECVSKENLEEFASGEETEDSIYWWVEFEDQIKTFETFSDVENFLLNEAVSSNKQWMDSMEKQQKNLNGM